MLLADVVAASRDVAEVAGRKAKVARLADLLASADQAEIPIVVGFLTGELRQGKVGVGFATIRDLSISPAPEANLTVHNIDGLADELLAISGPGSQIQKFDALRAVYGRATAEEQEFISRLLLGEMRQGALDGAMIDAIAAAANVKSAAVRRAHMLRGDLREVAETAMVEGTAGLSDVGLEVFRPLQPMLAKTAESLEAALEQHGTAILEWKLDGVRLQVHRDGARVRFFTRNLKDVTDRSEDLAGIVLGFPAERFVLDGEVIALRDDGRPHSFQVTMGRFGRHGEGDTPLTPFFFDILHLGGTDTVDDGAQRRLERLMSAVPTRYRIPQVVTSDVGRAQGFLDEALEAGHEGIMIKALDAPYAAGRRGASWQKLKPAHTLDLVVLAAEWGHGRRTGWLSNLHLGALDRDTGEYVMLGKTFKGLTDEMLAWQTERFAELETHRRDNVVYVNPEQVVEVAFDGVQQSTRYPGGMALRFARVKQYRDDKTADEADPLDMVRAIFDRSRE